MTSYNDVMIVCSHYFSGKTTAHIQKNCHSLSAHMLVSTTNIPKIMEIPSLIVSFQPFFVPVTHTHNIYIYIYNIYIYIYRYIYIYTYIYIYIYIFVCFQIGMGVCKHNYMLISMFICRGMHEYLWLCMYECMPTVIDLCSAEMAAIFFLLSSIFMQFISFSTVYAFIHWILLDLHWIHILDSFKKFLREYLCNS